MNFSIICNNVLSRQIRLHQQTLQTLLLGQRFLYTPGALGMDGYLQVRERVQAQFNELGDRFRSKMKDFVQPNSANMVFTEDLKHMVHLANGSEEDLALIEEMMLKFNKQNRDLRFGSFIFGPVVMRMYHHLNKPKEALSVFLNPDMQHFFDQIASFQILMDLLFKNEMYDEVMHVADIVSDKQLPNARYPRNIVVLAMAAAYKKNTPESLEYMKNLWSNLRDSGSEPMRKAVTFAAALAINQQAPHVALEILSTIIQQNYVTIRNLKVSALADVGRVDDTLPILRSVLEIEGPNEQKHTFCSEVIEKVKIAVDKSDKKEIHQEFQRIIEQLAQLQHITEVPLDTVLCSEIERIPINPRQSEQRILAAKFDPQNRGERFGRIRRPGLADLE